MSWTPYRGEAYLDFPTLTQWCQDLAKAHPTWVTLETPGTSRHERPLLLLTIGEQAGQPDEKPGFWLDGGTHAAEWAGVMSALFTVSRWVEALIAKDPATCTFFRKHTAYVLPCISPDGFQALHEGAPFLRSTLRPPRPGSTRSGFDPQDLDGDGAIRWMRWKHPAGPYVADPDLPLYMRPRSLDDDPAQAYFVAEEGAFVNWDGVRWTAAPREHGIDLNRNFPVRWAPFSMFGMDSGEYPTSEPESRTVVEAFGARPHIAAAVTNHTYTGAILTQPYREDTSLGSDDIAMMHVLASEAVAGTGYRVFKVHPEFSYDPKKPTVGVWSDTLSEVFGIPGYTLELWDPFGPAGVRVDDPAKFFSNPSSEIIRALIAHYSEGAQPWTPFEHPQLGAVEIGGIDYMRTVRNPPIALLAAECERAFEVAERVARSLPQVQATLDVQKMGSHTRVRLVLENLGFLPTSGLPHGERAGLSPGLRATLDLPDTVVLQNGAPEQPLSHLDGWGNSLHGFHRNTLYPHLPARGHRSQVEWLVEGTGRVSVRWYAGRSGRGTLHCDIV